MPELTFRRLRERVCTANTARVLWALLVIALLGDVVWYTTSIGRGIEWLDPQPILSLAALLLGVILLSWQLETQHKNTLEVIRREAQDRLRLDIYRELAARIEGTRAPLTELGMVPTAFGGELSMRVQAGGGASRYQFATLQDTSRRAADSVLALMSVLELYELALPPFTVFRERLAHAWRNAQVCFGDFLDAASPFLSPPLRWPPLPTESENLSRMANHTMGASVSVTGVVWDLRVEAQNYLLGGLFPGQRAPARTPGDPTVQVTSVSDETGLSDTTDPPPRP